MFLIHLNGKAHSKEITNQKLELLQIISVFPFLNPSSTYFSPPTKFPSELRKGLTLNIEYQAPAFFTFFSLLAI